jgi:hypothetical protein
MKFLALCTVAITSVCYGAAHQTSSSSAQAKAIFEITHHSMSYQTATEGNLSCIVADPKLLDRLPQDFAQRILKNMGSNQDAVTFKSALSKAHEENLPTDALKARITSVQIALLIVSKPGFARVTWQPQTFATSKPFYNPTHLTLTRSGKTIRAETNSFDDSFDERQEKEKEARKLENFGKQEHIRMLLVRGETDAVTDLTKEFLQKKSPKPSSCKKNSADLILKITPTPDTAPCCLL